jgi:hypothetical protein
MLDVNAKPDRPDKSALSFDSDFSHHAGSSKRRPPFTFTLKLAHCPRSLAATIAA